MPEVARIARAAQPGIIIVDLTPLLVYPAFEELRDKKEFIQFGLDQTIF